MQVCEIFPSLQGEGRNQGLRCCFLRLAGCNLNCRWCDTPDARDPLAGEDLTTGDILIRIEETGIRYLCVTGGEPLLRQDELLPLLRELSAKGYIIDIETNGTIPFRQAQPYASICMDLKCPSSGEESDLSLLADIRPTDSVKCVVADDADLDYVYEQIRSIPIRGEIYISPVHGSNYRRIAEVLMTWNLPVRLQLQLHKQIGVQ